MIALVLLLPLLAMPLTFSLAVISSHPDSDLFPQSSHTLEPRNGLYDTGHKFEPFVVRHVTLECFFNYNKTNYDCHLYLRFFDPNSVKQNNATSCHCVQRWPWNGTVLTRDPDDDSRDAQRLTCDTGPGHTSTDSIFEIAVWKFWGPFNFTAELSHTYHDDENFTHPWPTTRADARIQISHEYKHDKDIKLNTTGPIFAPVKSVID
ncbi:hypothetical protein QBC35DRAFT_82100 [Podospora australis]|uniref:Uncharacterized protein n=1 Tax=Podospora australis TaxID=1536484 RepID=A0AAN7AKE7_9PEZI|nr:hypothetical protein QBC35DRAFT_82100 [Podospora australis]